MIFSSRLVAKAIGTISCATGLVVSLLALEPAGTEWAIYGTPMKVSGETDSPTEKLIRNLKRNEKFRIHNFHWSGPALSGNVSLAIEDGVSVDEEAVIAEINSFSERVDGWIPLHRKPHQLDPLVVVGGDVSLQAIVQSFGESRLENRFLTTWKSATSDCRSLGANSGFARGRTIFIRLCRDKSATLHGSILRGTVHHELFHALQNQILASGGNPAAEDPFWIQEGSALFFELSEKAGTRVSAIIENSRLAFPKGWTIDALSNQSSQRHGAMTGDESAIGLVHVIALYDLTKRGAEPERIIELYHLLASGMSWQEAMSSALWDPRKDNSQPEAPRPN